MPMWLSSSLAVIGLAAAVYASGQTARGAAAIEAARSLLEEAGAAPVEVLADIALRQDLLPLLPKSEQAAVLERVFRRASEAHEQWPLLMAMSALPYRPDLGISPEHNPALDRYSASGLRLDSLSIRCRVVQALLGIDPKLARALFEEIPRPAPPQASCADSAVPDAGVYMETLAAVAERGAFSDEERRKGVPWLLIEHGLTGISGAVEMVAAARTFAPMVKTEAQAQMVSTKLALAMAQPDSDRAFTLALRLRVLITPALKVAYSARAVGASDAVIITALRGYLARQLSGARCRDNSGPNSKADSPTVEAFAEYLSDAERTDIAPLAPEEHTPSKLEDGYAPHLYANAPEFRALMKEVEDLPEPPVALRTSIPSLSPPLREFPEVRARDTLSRIADLKAVSGQDPVEVFHEKCRLLARILTPPVSYEARRIAIGETVHILGDAVILQRAPAEWLTEVQDLIAQTGLFELMAKTPAPAQESPATLHLDLAAALADSRLPALSLYGRMAQSRASKQ
jgi:hypothetical protein